MRVLFDTNVLLSAFLTEGLCSKLFARAKKKEFELYICPFVLNEFKGKLLKKFSATAVEIEEALSLIEDISIPINPVTDHIIVKGVCRDKDDDNVLACALAAKANYLVTGDPDLLTIGTYREIAIIKPREFELLFENV